MDSNLELIFPFLALLFGRSLSLVFQVSPFLESTKNLGSKVPLPYKIDQGRTELASTLIGKAWGSMWSFQVLLEPTRLQGGRPGKYVILKPGVFD